MRLLAEHERGSKLCRGRRRLNTEAALAGAPEECGFRCIEAVNRQPVRSEAPEAGPAPFDRFDRPIDHGFEPANGGCDINFFGNLPYDVLQPITFNGAFFYLRTTYTF